MVFQRAKRQQANEGNAASAANLSENTTEHAHKAPHTSKVMRARAAREKACARARLCVCACARYVSGMYVGQNPHLGTASPPPPAGAAPAPAAPSARRRAPCSSRAALNPPSPWAVCDSHCTLVFVCTRSYAIAVAAPSARRRDALRLQGRPEFAVALNLDQTATFTTPPSRRRLFFLLYNVTVYECFHSRPRGALRTPADPLRLLLEGRLEPAIDPP